MATPSLETLLHRTDSPSQPMIFDLQKKDHRVSVGDLFDRHEIKNVSDDYEEQLSELFAVNHPSEVYQPGFSEKTAEFIEKAKRSSPLWQQGRWVFYPWHAAIVHILEDANFQKVRMARNRNLINGEEQKTFYNAVIGIGGLSVGNSVALAIVLQGGGKHIRLADFDRLALSNINRVRAGTESLGVRKVEVTARQIYEMNPYANVEIIPEGLIEDNLDRFIAGPPKLDVIIDELDNIAIKYLIREKAKQYSIPVVMAADNGDNAVVDVERYDLDRNLPFFHGRLGDVTYEKLRSLDKFGIGKTITKHIGPENITARMQQSLLEMGKTIVSWPQLGGAAWINGSAVAYCVRKIVNHQSLENDRALISLDEKLIPDYHSPAAIAERSAIADSFRTMFGL